MVRNMGTCLSFFGYQPSQHEIRPGRKVSISLRGAPRRSTPYFWGRGWHYFSSKQPRHKGYKEARKLVGAGGPKDLESITGNALDTITELYATLENSDSTDDGGVKKQHKLDLVEICLSDQLQEWRKQQHAHGRILPGKGRGLRRASDEVIRILGAEKWPAPLLTSNVLFGTGWTNLLIGAYNPRTLYSNLCCDMGFFYEHGFDKVFPEFEQAISESAADPKARKTPCGTERRNAVVLGLDYIRNKADFEAKNVTQLARKSAKMDRRTAHTICFCEASLLGMAAEAMGRGFDPGAMFDDMVFSSPGTDVVDVGSDINNSEIMNSFLNTADITDTGVVTEAALRKVYDAYAATGARCLTERWMEPLINMNSLLYVWHMVNDRHFFLRRIVLGWSKVRVEKGEQREADFDEVFDQNYRTTGFSRPLKTGCKSIVGEEQCDALKGFIAKVGKKKRPLLLKLWSSLVEGPLAYAIKGVVDQAREEAMIHELTTAMAQAYRDGLILEQQWLIAHACHHAWQVNYLMEAAMFGSLLDDNSLGGKLDRVN